MSYTRFPPRNPANLTESGNYTYGFQQQFKPGYKRGSPRTFYQASIPLPIPQPIPLPQQQPFIPLVTQGDRMEFPVPGQKIYQNQGRLFTLIPRVSGQPNMEQLNSMPQYMNSEYEYFKSRFGPEVANELFIDQIIQGRL